jgi:ATP-dependent DNA helicase PIF1
MSTHGLDLSLLSAEQLRAFRLFEQGRNVFVSGPGGSGKSFLIRYFVQSLYSRGHIHQVTSTTGCSSILLSNQIHVGNTGRPIVVKTIHSWSGIRLGKGTEEEIIRNVMKNRKAVKEWKRVKTLVIDEISMLSEKLFSVLDTLGRTLRGVDRPFGGIQVVCLGDLYQLSPVGDYGDPASSNFCFESAAWNATFALNNHIELTTIYRQKDDVYKSILNEIRIGKLSDENQRLLKARVNQTYCAADHGGVVPMKIFATKEQVNRVNVAQYQRVEDTENVLPMVYIRQAKRYVENGEIIPEEVVERCRALPHEDIDMECKQLANNVPAETEIRLKRGVPVMCLVNLDVDAGIANGSLGVVVDFVASAIATNLDGKGTGHGHGHGASVSREMWPVVRFYNGVVKTMEPYVWQSGEIPTVCVRQFPLTLAYANSIHKMQGASLDVCEMDLGASIFAEHQIYVALSRVRSLEGVYLSAFHPHRIRVNPKVAAFYARFVRTTDTVLAEDEIIEKDTDEAEREAANIAAASGECPICMDRMEKPHQTACKHVFCQDCIMRHMQCTSRIPCCPMCRAEISVYTIQPVVSSAAKSRTVSSNKKTVVLPAKMGGGSGGRRPGHCLLVHKEE